jgi:hypothetical protein
MRPAHKNAASPVGAGRAFKKNGCGHGDLLGIASGDQEAITLNAVAGGPESLPSLAGKINSATAAAETHAKSAMQHALDAGRLLKEAKLQVEHGQWEEWLLANCSRAPRTAQLYMRLTTKLGDLPIEMRNAVADLLLREAMQAITTGPIAPSRASTSVRLMGGTEAARAVSVLRASAQAMQRSAREIDQSHPLNQGQVEQVRTRLQAAIAELDGLLAVAEQPTPEREAITKTAAATPASRLL